MSECKLRVGDRIKVYGWTHNGNSPCGVRATVIGDGPGFETIEIRWANGEEDVIHPKQCRRIKRKEKKRYWLPKEWDDTFISCLQEKGNEWLEIKPEGSMKHLYFEVREV